MGKHLLQVPGLDTAVTPRDSRLDTTMIAYQGRGRMAARYEVEGETHLEAVYGQHPGLLPMLPCFRVAFAAPEHGTQHGTRRQRVTFVQGDPSVVLVNTCGL